MPGVQNWQTSPLHFVDQIFSKNNVVPLSDDAETTRALSDRLKTSFKEVSNFFRDKVEPSKWSTIPSLNDVPLDDLYDGQIVRFRGMIQVKGDMGQKSLTRLRQIKLFMAKCWEN
jgi:hypothetical protein